MKIEKCKSRSRQERQKTVSREGVVDGRGLVTVAKGGCAHELACLDGGGCSESQKQQLFVAHAAARLDTICRTRPRC